MSEIVAAWTPMDGDESIITVGIASSGVSSTRNVSARELMIHRREATVEAESERDVSTVAEDMVNLQHRRRSARTEDMETIVADWHLAEQTPDRVLKPTASATSADCSANENSPGLLSFSDGAIPGTPDAGAVADLTAPLPASVRAVQGSSS